MNSTPSTTSDALDELRSVHGELGLDQVDLLQQVYAIERRHQYEDDPQVRLSEIRQLVTLTVNTAMEHDEVPADSDGEAP